MTTRDEFQAKVTKADINMERFNGIVNGPAEGPDSLVETDGGFVPTFARILAEGAGEAGDGRNLIAKDDSETSVALNWGRSGWGFSLVTDGTLQLAVLDAGPLEANASYSLQFKARLVSGSDESSVDLYADLFPDTLPQSDFFAVTETEEVFRWEDVGSTSDDMETAVLRLILAEELPEGTTVEITDIKFERGSVASNWTPSDRDKADKLLVPSKAALLLPNGATLIATIRTETGAVVRNVQEALRDRVSVKDFGAVGDGQSRPLSTVTSYQTIDGLQDTTEWTLDQWKTIYPFATSLDQELDACAHQAAVNTGKRVDCLGKFWMGVFTVDMTLKGASIAGGGVNETYWYTSNVNTPVFHMNGQDAGFVNGGTGVPQVHQTEGGSFIRMFNGHNLSSVGVRCDAGPPIKAFTASVAGDVMTVTAVGLGTIVEGEILVGNNIASQLTVLSQLTQTNGDGPGLRGTYRVNINRNAASGGVVVLPRFHRAFDFRAGIGAANAQYGYYVGDYEINFAQYGMHGGPDAGFVQDLKIGPGSVSQCSIAGMQMDNVGGLYIWGCPSLLQNREAGFRSLPKPGQQLSGGMIFGLLGDTTTNGPGIDIRSAGGSIVDTEFLGCYVSSSGTNPVTSSITATDRSGFRIHEDTYAAFTASISGVTMTVTAMGSPSAPLFVGARVNGVGVARDTVITGMGSGSGGVGTYTVSISQTVASGAKTATGTISGVRITGGESIGNLGHGYEIGASDSVVLTGVMATYNSVFSAGTFDGVRVGALSRGTSILGGRMGAVGKFKVSGLGHLQGFGIRIEAGAENTDLMGPNCFGNYLGPIFNGAGSNTWMVVRPRVAGTTSEIQTTGDVTIGGFGPQTLFKNSYYRSADGTFRYNADGPASYTKISTVGGVTKEELWVAPVNAAGPDAVATFTFRGYLAELPTIPGSTSAMVVGGDVTVGGDGSQSNFMSNLYYDTTGTPTWRYAANGPGSVFRTMVDAGVTKVAILTAPPNLAGPNAPATVSFYKFI